MTADELSRLLLGAVVAGAELVVVLVGDVVLLVADYVDLVIGFFMSPIERAGAGCVTFA